VDPTEHAHEGNTLADLDQSTQGGPGATIAGRYRLEAQLGAGGMGVVHRARDLERGDVVAIKLVRAGQRFDREVAALAAVVHPGVVGYRDHGFDREGVAFLVMELIDGEDLARRLARGSVTLEQTLALARQIASALVAAHAAGVVHRDLKPSNIVLPGGQFEHAKLLDFGVARLRGLTSLTGTGHVLGTPGYMSPEQARGLADVDGRTDVYSLGCVLFECLTGEPPFPGNHAVAVLAKILLEDTPRIGERLRSLGRAVTVPRALDELVHAMMARDRADRLATPGEVLARLGALDLATTERGPAPSLSHRERRVLSVLFVGRTGASAGVGEELGGQAIELVDGSVLISFPSAETPTDQAARAARCALLVHARQPRAAIVLVSGHGVISRRSLIGEVIDRGAEIVQQTRAGEIRLDEPTAALIEPICVVDYDDEGARLQSMRGSEEPLRTLLGRPTPFVGRARELAALEAMIHESLTEPCTNAAVVVGEPGLGKSRLRYEMVRRVALRWPELEVWIGRADPLGADAAFGLLARALRGAVPLLSELVGIPGEVRSPVLESVRAHPQLLREAIADAWDEWLGHRCERGGVLLVLEDLHWGDLGTIELVGRALLADDERPLVVLALARPELDERFPNLWAACDPHRIELELLPRRAARKLVGRVLGNAAPAVVDALIDRAGGNAFYLEELIRAAARGSADTLPDTVVGMVQSRLLQLSPALRRVLRAGSVFGEVCWSGGVARLLGETEVATSLDELAADEFLTRRGHSTVPGSTEWAFRHALVRDAVYATLTPDDRRVAHALAGEWLVSTSAAEAAVLARHFMLGARPDIALGWFEKAALGALDAEDHARARKLVDDGLACGAEGDALGRLQAILARIAEEAGEHTEAIGLAELALSHLREGSQQWYTTIFVLLESLGRTSRFEEIEPWLERALAASPAPEAIDACVRASARGALHLLKAGRLAVAREHVERTRMLTTRHSPGPLARLDCLWLETELADMAGNVGRMVELLGECEAVVEKIDSPMLRAFHGSSSGHVFAQVGANERAEAGFEQEYAYVARRGLRHRLHASLGMLAILAHRRGDLDRATELLVEVRAVETPDRRFIGVLAGLASTLALARGALDEALAEAQRAEAMLGVARPLHPYGLAILANALRARGQLDEARDCAERAMAIVDELGSVPEIEVDVQVAYVEALLAVGRRERANDELRRFEVRFDERLAGIADPELRACFCTGVPANARLLELCRKVLPTQE
jgi:tetratricopeptide (TPR) repeat protein